MREWQSLVLFWSCVYRIYQNPNILLWLLQHHHLRCKLVSYPQYVSKICGLLCITRILDSNKWYQGKVRLIWFYEKVDRARKHKIKTMSRTWNQVEKIWWQKKFSVWYCVVTNVHTAPSMRSAQMCQNRVDMPLLACGLWDSPRQLHAATIDPTRTDPAAPMLG